MDNNNDYTPHKNNPFGRKRKKKHVPLTPNQQLLLLQNLSSPGPKHRPRPIDEDKPMPIVLPGDTSRLARELREHTSDIHITEEMREETLSDLKGTKRKKKDDRYSKYHNVIIYNVSDAFACILNLIFLCLLNGCIQNFCSRLSCFR